MHRHFQPTLAFLFAVTVSLLPFSAVADAETTSSDAVEELQTMLETGKPDLPVIRKAEFATTPLTRDDAGRARQLIWKAFAKRIRTERAAEMKARKVVIGKLEMPFFYRVAGDKPKRGRSLFISLHGGGGTTAQVNNGQWENQKRLYSPEEGVYLVPRAPTNTWNLWHQGHIDQFFDRIITNMIVFEDVNPDRVYVMGYSAGGDGVYQLAPRMADRWAAASMMAGHPNDASPLSLRNIGFTLHVGGRDGAYNRNGVAKQWQTRLADLRKNDEKGYFHLAKIYPNKGHWLDREDAAAVPWMSKLTRDPFPERIVWRQDDVTHTRSYWLSVDGKARRPRSTIIAERDGQTIRIESADVPSVGLLLNDRMLDLDKEVVVVQADKELFRGKVTRTISTIAATTLDRGDTNLVFSASVQVSPKAAE